MTPLSHPLIGPATELVSQSTPASQPASIIIRQSGLAFICPFLSLILPDGRKMISGKMQIYTPKERTAEANLNCEIT